MGVIRTSREEVVTSFTRLRMSGWQHIFPLMLSTDNFSGRHRSDCSVELMHELETRLILYENVTERVSPRPSHLTFNRRPVSMTGQLE